MILHKPNLLKAGVTKFRQKSVEESFKSLRDISEKLLTAKNCLTQFNSECLNVTFR